MWIHKAGVDFFFLLLGMWDLSSPTRDQVHAPVVEAWNLKAGLGPRARQVG